MKILNWIWILTHLFMKALMKYNEDEIDDFMEGSRVNDEPKFSKDFENRLKKALEELEDELK